MISIISNEFSYLILKPHFYVDSSHKQRDVTMDGQNYMWNGTSLPRESLNNWIPCSISAVAKINPLGVTNRI